MFAKLRESLNLPIEGKMPEWLNGTVSKTVIRATVSGVRIPLFPQILLLVFAQFMVFSRNPLHVEFDPLHGGIDGRHNEFDS